MGARPRSWWQKIKQHRVAVGIVTVVLAVIIALIIAGYWFDWTGFNGYNKVTTTHTISGTNAGTVTKTEEYQPGKALWDWLNLLGVLAIPAVVGLGVAWFTTKFNEQQSRTEHEIASDNQSEAALQGYLDRISELLLHEQLSSPEASNEVIKIARARTLAMLYQLDTRRTNYMLACLRELGLIATDTSAGIITFNKADLNRVNLYGVNFHKMDLSEANLSEANLNRAIISEANLCGATLISATLIDAHLKDADLSGANLSGANLKEANLRNAILIRVDFWHANLSGADLSGALVTTEQLETARSLKGATMSDGSIHP